MNYDCRETWVIYRREMFPVLSNGNPCCPRGRDKVIWTTIWTTKTICLYAYVRCDIRSFIMHVVNKLTGVLHLYLSKWNNWTSGATTYSDRVTDIELDRNTVLFNIYRVFCARDEQGTSGDPPQWQMSLRRHSYGKYTLIFYQFIQT